MIIKCARWRILWEFLFLCSTFFLLFYALQRHNSTRERERKLKHGGGRRSSGMQLQWVSEAPSHILRLFLLYCALDRSLCGITREERNESWKIESELVAKFTEDRLHRKKMLLFSATLEKRSVQLRKIIVGCTQHKFEEEDLKLRCFLLAFVVFCALKFFCFASPFNFSLCIIQLT